MNPHIIKLLSKGYEEKIKQQDYLAWMFNQYTLSAVFVAIEHNFAGKKAVSEYVNKPFLSDMQTEERKQMTEEERIQAERNRQYMILKVMQTNFELSKM